MYQPGEHCTVQYAVVSVMWAINQRSTAQFSTLLSVSCGLSTRGALHSSLRCCQCHVGYQPEEHCTVLYAVVSVMWAMNQRSTAQFSTLLSVSCGLSTRGALHSSLRCCQCHVGYQPEEHCTVQYAVVSVCRGAQFTTLLSVSCRGAQFTTLLSVSCRGAQFTTLLSVSCRGAQFTTLLSDSVMFQPEKHYTVQYAVVRQCHVSTREALHSSVSCCQCHVGYQPEEHCTVQ